MASMYAITNGTSSNTAAPTRVTTGTAAKTMLQIGVPATRSITIVEWSISFDGTDATKTPVQVELLTTDFAAAVTGITPTPLGPDTTASLCASGTSATGYTASGEGTASGTARLLDYIDLDPNKGAFIKQYPLGREPFVPPSKFVRIRVTTATAVNAICRIVWEE